MIDESFVDPTGELPPSLLKALRDSFDYALGLKNGHVIHFSEAHLLKGERWIKLIGFNETIEMDGVSFSFPRGLDVRISEIAWVADAPNGS